MDCKAADTSRVIEGNEGNLNKKDVVFDINEMSDVSHLASNSSSEDEQVIQSDIIPKIKLMHPRAESTRLERVVEMADSGRGSSIVSNDISAQPSTHLTCQEKGVVLHQQALETDTSPETQTITVPTVTHEMLFSMLKSFSKELKDEMTQNNQLLTNKIESNNQVLKDEIKSIAREVVKEEIKAIATNNQLLTDRIESNNKELKDEMKSLVDNNKSFEDRVNKSFELLLSQNTSLESRINIINDEQQVIKEQVISVQQEAKETKQELINRIDSQNENLKIQQTKLEERVGVQDEVVMKLQGEFKESQVTINKLEEKCDENSHKVQMHDVTISTLSNTVANIQTQELAIIKENIQDQSRDITTMQSNRGEIRKQVANPTFREIKSVVNVEVPNHLSYIQFHGSLKEYSPALIQHVEEMLRSYKNESEVQKCKWSRVALRGPAADWKSLITPWPISWSAFKGGGQKG